MASVFHSCFFYLAVSDVQGTAVTRLAVVDSYIRWYNEKRIKISLGSLSPVEYRESLGFTT
jgi:hypothetical protein